MSHKSWAQSLKALGIHHFVDKLQNGEPFSFARYGDGEWFTIFGGRYIGMHNSNGCTFTTHLSDCLRQVLDDQNPYMHATLRIAHRKLGDRIGGFLEHRGVALRWYRGDVLLDQSLKGNLWPLVRELQKKRILFVGPNHLRGIDEMFFQYVDFINPPKRNAIMSRHILVPAILRSIKDKKIDVVAWCCGLHTKVFINDIWKEYGDRITQIDFGSMFDGYFAVGSRSYVRRGLILWNDLQQVNGGHRERRAGETFRRGEVGTIKA